MPLDPALRAMLERGAAARTTPLSELPIEDARAGFRAGIVAGLGPDYVPVELAEVVDRTIESVPVRIYRPAADGPLPVVAFAHAGGYVIGDLDTHDEVCRHLADSLPAVVVAVHYRLAPEHPYPAATDDFCAVVRWLGANAGELGGDPDRLALVGDSAGGNLVAAAALRARADGGPALVAQALAYPLTDSTTEIGRREGGSYLRNGVGLGLTAATMDWFLDCYLPDREQRTWPDASPVAADLAGLPPAVVATAEFDPLRDEGDEYARRLATAGVPVTHLPFDGLVHGFLWQVRVSPAAAKARDAFVDALRTLLAEEIGTA